MKIAAIRSIVKDAGVCVIYTSERGRQWLGTNKAMFLCEEGLKITEGMAAEIAKAEKRGMPIRYFTDDCMEMSGGAPGRIEKHGGN